MSRSVLITGGTGLIGRHLSQMLVENGYKVHILSRSKRNHPDYKFFIWDIDKGYIEEGALDVDYIIHLAGAGIADKRWSDKRKKLILDSRIKSTDLLASEIAKLDKKPHYIGASAIGIYGNIDDHSCKEEDASREDIFLVEVTRKWEDAHQEIKQLVPSWSMVRIGIVLSPEGGALQKLLIPYTFRMGNYFGKGDQVMSWIHIEDQCRLFLHLIEHNLSGIYNAVSPSPVTSKKLVQTIAAVKPGPYLLFGIPTFILKWIFGEMAQTILSSTKVSADKISDSGFSFHYPEVKSALSNMLGK